MCKFVELGLAFGFDCGAVIMFLDWYLYMAVLCFFRMVHVYRLLCTLGVVFVLFLVACLQLRYVDIYSVLVMLLIFICVCYYWFVILCILYGGVLVCGC